MAEAEGARPAEDQDEAVSLLQRIRAGVDALEVEDLDLQALDDITADVLALHEVALASRPRHPGAAEAIPLHARREATARGTEGAAGEAALETPEPTVERLKTAGGEAPPDIAAVVIATGKRDRMNSDIPKILHPIAGRPMIVHALGALAELSFEHTVVVVDAGMEEIASVVAPAAIAVMEEPLGTGNSVMAARQALKDFTGDILVLFGDMPLMQRSTLEALVAARHTWPRPSVAVLGFRPEDPAQYGRLVMVGEELHAVVPFTLATPEIRAIRLCSAGVMVVDGNLLFGLLDSIVKDKDNVFDIVTAARARSLTCTVVVADADEIFHVDSREDLGEAELRYQNRLRHKLLGVGVTLLDPDTIYLSHDTVIGKDSVVGPNVVFGPGVTVGARVTIKAFTHLEGVRVADGATVGPLQRIEPGKTEGLEGVEDAADRDEA